LLIFLAKEELVQMKGGVIFGQWLVILLGVGGIRKNMKILCAI
jgi:hypothetical protein